MTEETQLSEREKQARLAVQMERKKADITRLRDVTTKLSRASAALDRLNDETEKKRLKDRVESLIENVGTTIEREVSEVRDATLSAREKASSRELLELPKRTLHGAAVDHLTIEELRALDKESEAPADSEATPEVGIENR